MWCMNYRNIKSLEETQQLFQTVADGAPTTSLTPTSISDPFFPLRLPQWSLAACTVIQKSISPFWLFLLCLALPFSTLSSARTAPCFMLQATLCLVLYVIAFGAAFCACLDYFSWNMLSGVAMWPPKLLICLRNGTCRFLFRPKLAKIAPNGKCGNMSICMTAAVSVILWGTCIELVVYM